MKIFKEKPQTKLNKVSGRLLNLGTPTLKYRFRVDVIGIIIQNNKQNTDRQIWNGTVDRKPIQGDKDLRFSNKELDTTSEKVSLVIQLLIHGMLLVIQETQVKTLLCQDWTWYKFNARCYQSQWSLL